MPRTKKVRQKSSLLKRRDKSSVLSQAESQRSSSCSSQNEKLMNVVTKEYESVEEFIEEYGKFNKELLEKQKQSYEEACKIIQEIMRNDCPQFLESKNIGDISEDLNDQNKDPNMNGPKIRPSRSRTPVDLFPFKRPKTPSVRESKSSARKRSASASAASSASSIRNIPGGFKTPLMSDRRMMPYSVITPKISDTPMSMMRRPLHGEVAVSMSGSPLMVGPIASEEVPTVNVPLQDGRVFSIMPEPGAPPPDLPQIDNITLQYLKTLRAHLKIMAPDTP